MIDVNFFIVTIEKLLVGLPLTLELMSISVTIGIVFAVVLASIRIGGPMLAAYVVRVYVAFFRGTPLLVQFFIIYFGPGQFPVVRESVLWPILREPYWCALLSLSAVTAAYGSEIIRGAVQSVSWNDIEAARAFGMSRVLVLRRIIFPIALRRALPAYGNEIILMVKATSLASTITLMEVSGIAYRLISETYRVVEVFVCAGLIYLAVNFFVTRLIASLELKLAIPHREMTS